MMKRIIFLIAPIFLIPSCVEYRPGPVNLPQSSAWKMSHHEEGIACPEEMSVHDAAVTQWWQVFRDEDLSVLEKQALFNNFSIQSAVARLEAAEALYLRENASRFPHIDFTASAQRQRLPRDLGGIGGLPQQTTSNSNASSSTTTTTTSPVTGLPVTTTTRSKTKTKSTTQTLQFPEHVTQLQLLPQLTYEADFWGKYRQLAESAFEHAASIAEDLNTALLLLSAEVASKYFELRALDAEIDVLEKTTSAKRELSIITQVQFEGGLDTVFPPLQQEIELAQIAQNLEETKRKRVVAENALAILLGTSPSSFSFQKKSFIASLPLIPTNLPAEILARRPDIRQKEHLLEEQRLKVGVAKTAYFPDITLGGGYGFQSDHASSLFKWKNHIWNLAANLITPIFDAGKITATVHVEKARYKEIVAQFCDTVINAFGEVENALANVQSTQQQIQYVNARVVFSKEIYAIAMMNYDTGLIDFTHVIDAQLQELSNEREQVLMTKDQLFATILLIKSIGGSWNYDQNQNYSSVHTSH